MYADDAVIYVHNNSKQKTADVLQGALENIADRMVHSCIKL